MNQTNTMCSWILSIFHNLCPKDVNSTITPISAQTSIFSSIKPRYLQSIKFTIPTIHNNIHQDSYKFGPHHTYGNDNTKIAYSSFKESFFHYYFISHMILMNQFFAAWCLPHSLYHSFPLYALSFSSERRLNLTSGSWRYSTHNLNFIYANSFLLLFFCR